MFTLPEESGRIFNINMILDDRREKQAKSPVLDQSGVWIYRRKINKYNTGN